MVIPAVLDVEHPGRQMLWFDISGPIGIGTASTIVSSAVALLSEAAENERRKNEKGRPVTFRLGAERAYG